MLLGTLGILGRYHMIIGDGGGEEGEVREVKGRPLSSFFNSSSLASVSHFRLLCGIRFEEKIPLL